MRFLEKTIKMNIHNIFKNATGSKKPTSTPYQKGTDKAKRLAAAKAKFEEEQAAKKAAAAKVKQELDILKSQPPITFSGRIYADLSTVFGQSYNGLTMKILPPNRNSNLYQGYSGEIYNRNTGYYMQYNGVLNIKYVKRKKGVSDPINISIDISNGIKDVIKGLPIDLDLIVYGKYQSLPIVGLLAADFSAMKTATINFDVDGNHYSVNIPLSDSIII